MRPDGTIEGGSLLDSADENAALRNALHAIRCVVDAEIANESFEAMNNPAYLQVALRRLCNVIVAQTDKFAAPAMGGTFVKPEGPIATITKTFGPTS